MKRFCFHLLFLMFAVVSYSTPFFAYGVGIDDAKGGLTNAAQGNYLTGGVGIPFYASIILNAAFALLGVIFLILMVYAGMLWMLAEGDEKKVSNARGYIFHSILGLILVLASYAITSFVINALK